MTHRAPSPTSLRLVPALALALALCAGCDSDAVVPDPDPEALFVADLEALDLTSADLEGIDLDALQQAIDFTAVAEAARASRDEGEPTARRRGRVQFVVPGESIQAAVEAAPDVGVVFVRPGTYEEVISINKSLHLVGLGRPGGVVIQDPGGEANGIFARDVSGLSLINLTVRGFSRNGVFFVDVDGFALIRLFTDQLREGAYGLFPVRSRNGLIAHCTATGADDAGIYVGQSENVAVVHNETYGNVIGLEAENVKRNVWAHNRAYDNAAGMLAILLPPSQYVSVLHAEELTIAHNRLTDNNGENFAEEGDLASFVPSGTGLLVAGYDKSLITRNRVTGNAFVGIGLGSTFTLLQLAGRLPTSGPFPDLGIDPDPDGVEVVDNDATGNGFGSFALPLPPVDLLWDGSGEGNCWAGNDYGSRFPEPLPSCEASV